tara:strand:+ start:4448 stop:5044 length:597 start_codon:yes stop_codon:yes gene_type:complete
MKTQRFNPPKDWLDDHLNYNQYFLGFSQMLSFISLHFKVENTPRPRTMIEIGSFMGESTQMFAASGIFDTIHTMDPFEGDEKFLIDYDLTWDQVKNEYKQNIRNFNNIQLHERYSYDIVSEFENDSIDLVYIDGAHDYQSVLQDLEYYLPKVKRNGLMGGHDYNKFYEPYEDVIRAVNQVVGQPSKLFPDTSWLKVIR